MYHKAREALMEDACRKGLVKAIGVSNMKIQHLQKLKETAKLWPPAVNQVELHPLYPQQELLEYCQKEGIVVQAYSSLGGQDTGKAAWSKLLGTGKQLSKKAEKTDLLNAGPVIELATKYKKTPAQILLRWGLERGCALIPKTASKERLSENAAIFDFSLSKEEVDELQRSLLTKVQENNPGADVEEVTRLCWRKDPLRHLDFE